MNEVEWEELADKVSLRLAGGMKFYDAVDAALREQGIRVRDGDNETKRFYCSALGKRLGSRKKRRVWR